MAGFHALVEWQASQLLLLAICVADFPVAIVVPVITGVLLLDGVVSRFDGVLMLGIFLAWLAATVIEAREQRSTAPQDLGAKSMWTSVLSCAGGLALLVAAGVSIVSGAKGIAIAFGIDEFIIGATIVSMATTKKTSDLIRAHAASRRSCPHGNRESQRR